MDEKNDEIENFISVLVMYINYWNSVDDRDCKEKLEGLTHSILCVLDGISCAYNGDIHAISENCKSIMLHDQLYKNNGFNTGK